MTPDPGSAAPPGAAPVPARYRVGIDIGGTFTDAVCLGSDGEVRIAKTMSTPGHLADGVLDAIRGLRIDLAGCDWLVHGTTAGLNAILERRGARAALLTTAGFADVLSDRPHQPPAHVRPLLPHTPPLIAEQDIFEVRERTGARGEVVTALDEDQLARIASRLHGYEAVGIVFLHAYANSAHERAARDLLAAELPGVPVLCSHEIAPEWREYERASATAASAYVAPPISGYLTALAGALASAGLTAGLRVMQSNSGVMTVPAAMRKPAQTLFSGPVGGTTAGVAIAADLGLDHLICADMGGTSFDQPGRGRRGRGHLADLRRGLPPAHARRGHPHHRRGRRQHRLGVRGRPARRARLGSVPRPATGAAVRGRPSPTRTWRSGSSRPPPGWAAGWRWTPGPPVMRSPPSPGRWP